MLIPRGGRWRTEVPPPLAMERVGSLRLLGVTIASDLSVSAHIDALFNAGARSIYALRLLRAHGLSDQALKIVARATTINRIQYAGPTWWGYSNAADKGRIQRFLERMFKSGFLTEQDTDIESQMTAEDDNYLLRAVVRNERHVLRHLFPSEKPRIYDLRPRVHNFILPLKDDSNFIPRVLFRLWSIGPTLLSVYLQHLFSNCVYIYIYIYSPDSTDRVGKMRDQRPRTAIMTND